MDACVACGANQVLVIPVWDVAVGFWLAEPLGQAKVDDVHRVRLVLAAHQEVVGFDIAVDVRFVVHVLDARNLQAVGRECETRQTGRWKRKRRGGNTGARTIWSASMMTVLTENLREHVLKQSSSDGPSSSITMQLWPCSVP